MRWAERIGGSRRALRVTMQPRTPMGCAVAAAVGVLLVVAAALALTIGLALLLPAAVMFAAVYLFAAARAKLRTLFGGAGSGTAGRRNVRVIDESDSERRRFR